MYVYYVYFCAYKYCETLSFIFSCHIAIFILWVGVFSVSFWLFWFCGPFKNVAVGFCFDVVNLFVLLMESPLKDTTEWYLCALDLSALFIFYTLTPQVLRSLNNDSDNLSCLFSGPKKKDSSKVLVQREFFHHAAWRYPRRGQSFAVQFSVW